MTGAIAGPRSGRWVALAAATAGALAVILGALGAHALQARLSATSLDVWHVAVRFQMWHALALAASVLPARHSRGVRCAAILFAFGIVLFCGSLYALALGAPRLVGIITPFGGLSFIAGWFVFGIGLYRYREGGKSP